MKKHSKSFILFISLFFLFTLAPQTIFASSIINSATLNKLDLNSINQSKIDDLKNTIENISSNTNIDSNNVSSTSIDTIIEAYNELSDIISNEEMAELIEDNKDVLSDLGINKNVLSATSTVLKTFDAETVIDVIQNDINLNEIIENSDSTEEVITSVLKNTTTSDKIQITFKLLFSNGYFKLIFFFVLVIFIYSIIINALLFKKANKPAWATLIPIYRYCIYLKLYNFSPWWVLLLFVPIIGWLALIAISIIGKFELSKNFGHGFLFGIGLLFLPIFFKTYIVLSNDHFIDTVD